MISYIMTESDKGNAAIRITIDHTSYPEVVWGWKGYERLKQLDNMISKEEMAEIKLNLQMTDKLWHNKNKESKVNSK